MAAARITKKETAKEKYARKVCGYLDLDRSACERVFETLYQNMKAAFEAALR